MTTVTCVHAIASKPSAGKGMKTLDPFCCQSLNISVYTLAISYVSVNVLVQFMVV